MANSLNLDLTTLVYNTNSYSNPSWITSLDGSKISGTISQSQITNLTLDLASKLNLSGGTMSGNLLLNADPTSSAQAATKNYVDIVSSGFSVFSALAATTGNIAGTYNNGASGIGSTFIPSATGSFSIDGVTVATGLLFLLKDQTSQIQNGLYYCLTNGGPGTSAQFTRPSNYNTPAQINPGDLFVISQGSTNAGLTFLQTANVTTIGTSPITFTQWGGQSITLSGDVTGSGMSPVTTTIANSAVTNSKISNATIDLTTKVTGILPSANGGTASAFFTVSGPSTSAKTFTFPNASATVLTTNAAVTVPQGGTGLTAGTQGGIPYFNNTNTMASSGALSVNQIVLGGGSSTMPTVVSSLGTTTTVLHGNASGAPSFSAVSLTADVSGVLPIANGGTNSSSQVSSGVGYFNGTSITSNANFTFDGSASITVTSSVDPFNRAKVNGTPSGSSIEVYRPNNSSTAAYYSFYTSSNIKWSIGLSGTSNDSLYFIDQTNTANRLILDQSGNVNIPGLTASLPIFTDSSKNLTNTGTVPAANGGTGQSSYAVGDILYASGSTTISKLADVATGNALISGGVTTAPLWGKIGLTTHVSGTLPIANGGTNQASFATPVSGLNPISYYDGTRLSSTAKFGFDPVFDIARINSNLANPQFSISTSVTGSSNSVSIALSRGDQTNGGIFEYFQTGASTNWQNGMYPTSDDFIFKNPSTAVLTLGNTSTDVTVGAGNLLVNTAGKGLRVKEGSNAKQGVTTLVAGTAVVSNTSVTANSRIFITPQNSSGTSSYIWISARTASTSFTISSGSALDTRDIAWEIFEPA